MVKLRLKRMGSINKPFYRIVSLDSRKKRDGAYIESIGYYDPKTDPFTLKVDVERALYWLGVGAQPSDTVRSLLKKAGVMEKFHYSKFAEKEEIEKEAKKPAKKAVKKEIEKEKPAEKKETEKKVKEPVKKEVKKEKPAEKKDKKKAAVAVKKEKIESPQPVEEKEVEATQPETKKEVEETTQPEKEKETKPEKETKE